MLNPRPYAFPALGTLDAVEREADRGRKEQLEMALRDAIANGFAEGLTRGRTEAESEAQQIRQAAHGEGYEAGRAEALADLRQATTALQGALAQFETQRAAVIAEAEAFCVDLALAAVARVVETQSARTEFVRRMIKAALVALAPAPAAVIFVNPADRKALGRELRGLPLRDDEALTTGSARVEAGRLVVQSSIDEVLDQIRTAVVELKTKRTGRKAKPKEKSKRGASNR